MRWIVLGLCLMVLPSYATTYICVVQGKPVYTTEQMGNSCEISNMNGIGEREQITFAPPPIVSSQVALPTTESDEDESVEPTSWLSDPLYQLWHELEYGSYDKVPIVPMTQLPKNNEIAPVKIIKPKMAQTKDTFATKSATAYLPSIKRFNRVGSGLVNRRQILLQEIQREQAALTIAREQLTAARKRNDTAAIKKYSLMVLDREQNVIALSRELRR